MNPQKKMLVDPDLSLNGTRKLWAGEAGGELSHTELGGEIPSHGHRQSRERAGLSQECSGKCAAADCWEVRREGWAGTCEGAAAGAVCGVSLPSDLPITPRAWLPQTSPSLSKGDTEVAAQGAAWTRPLLVLQLSSVRERAAPCATGRGAAGP